MRLIAGTLLAALVATSAVAQQPTTPPAPAPAPAPEQMLATDPLNTSATYAFIIDGDAGIPLYSKRGDEPMIPASMSKLMLYYMVFERIKAGRLALTDEFTVSEHAWRTGGAGTDGSTMFLPLNMVEPPEAAPPVRQACSLTGTRSCSPILPLRISRVAM